MNELVAYVEKRTPPDRVDEDEWDAYLEHCDNIGADPTKSHFDACRAGSAGSDLEWVEQFIDEVGTLESLPDNLRIYFDTAAYLRDIKLRGEVDFVDVGGTTYAFWRR